VFGGYWRKRVRRLLEKTCSAISGENLFGGLEKMCSAIIGENLFGGLEQTCSAVIGENLFGGKPQWISYWRDTGGVVMAILYWSSL